MTRRLRPSRSQALNHTETPADSLRRALNEHAGVQQSLEIALLYTKMRDVVLVRGRVCGVDDRELCDRDHRILSVRSFIRSSKRAYLQHCEVVVALAVWTECDGRVGRRVHDTV